MMASSGSAWNQGVRKVTERLKMIRQGPTSGTDLSHQSMLLDVYGSN